MKRRILFSALFLLFLQSCLTYYEKNLVFHQEFARRDYVKADNLLDKNKFLQKNRNQLLYFLDKGLVSQLRGDYVKSNEYFEQAYIYVEDFDRNYGQEAVALLTNDMMRKYGGEDFEKIFIHYYKAINYIKLNELDEAMVECKRINIRLQEISDKYKSEKKYKRDAFAHTLMGLLYEASGDENNAFIAYRNAYEIYSEDYKNYFDAVVPLQLKKDLVRLATLNGFTEDKERYEEQFQIKYDRRNRRPKNELVVFWHNGLGPVKEEWSINFVVVKGQGGYVSFVNKELGLNFGFYMRSGDDQASLNDLRIVRVAFPKYGIRKQGLTSATVTYNSEIHQLELLEDINKIAIKSLNDRMMREMSKALLRLAIKQATAAAAREENEGLGTALTVFNAVSEKADTRNWQTLPAQIHYTRIPMMADTNQVLYTMYRGKTVAEQIESTIITKGKIKFVFHLTVPLESIL